MVSGKLRPQTLEERVVYWTILGTWGIWLVGGLYVVGSLLGYGLIGLQLARVLGFRPGEQRLVRAPPAVVMAWLAGMLTMLLALVLAHIDFELGPAQTLKSSIGWMKGWALLAVYIGVGATMSIRPILIARACSLLAVQTLAIAPVLWSAELGGLPSELYVSPLHAVVGASPEFFDVTLHQIDATTGRARWRFFAPWATAAAFLAGLGIFIAFAERSLRLRLLCVLSALVVCLMSGSRLSVVALPLVAVMVATLSRITRPGTWVMLAFAATIAVLLASDLAMIYGDATETFNNARAASSRVRAALGNIAAYRGLNEAPIFGHGILERGGHVVEQMLIGSHHTWWGLLFVKGIVGFVALAIPMAWTGFDLLVKAQADRLGRAGLGILLSILFFSLADNIEIIAYLIWPALIVLGGACGRRVANPAVGYLGAAGDWASSASVVRTTSGMVPGAS